MVEDVREGADHFVDYAQADWQATDTRYDVVFDINDVSSFRAARRSLATRSISNPSRMRNCCTASLAGVGCESSAITPRPGKVRMISATFSLPALVRSGCWAGRMVGIMKTVVAIRQL